MIDRQQHQLEVWNQHTALQYHMIPSSFGYW